MSLQQAFDDACINGDIKCAKEIYEKFGDKIDIYHNEEYVFQICCLNDYIKIAKWLYLLGEKKGRIFNIQEMLNVFNNNCYQYFSKLSAPTEKKNDTK